MSDEKLRALELSLRRLEADRVSRHPGGQPDPYLDAIRDVRQALAGPEPATGEGREPRVCPACGDDSRHDIWPVGDDSYACDRTSPPEPQDPEPARGPAAVDGLDAAWREAEAALPEGWRLTLAQPDDTSEGAWGAWATSEAFYEGESDADDQRAEGFGPTPAAALRALAARLREQP